MEEQLISNKTSKLAYKKRFNEDACNYCIVLDKTQNKELKLFYDATSKIHDNFTILGLLPTQSLLQKWLREKHNIDISIHRSFSMNKSYHYCILIDNNYDEGNELQQVCAPNRTYEEALEDALIKSLNLIK